MIFFDGNEICVLQISNNNLNLAVRKEFLFSLWFVNVIIKEVGVSVSCMKLLVLKQIIF